VNVVKISIEDLDFEKGKGLMPAIVQEFNTREVLMVAYVNEESLRRTLETGYTHYWSRSRKRLWKKGESSGNVQRIERIMVDCDSDAILFLVHQTGNACHKGVRSCFHNEIPCTATKPL